MTQQRDGGPAFPATLQVEVDEVNKDGVIVGKCTLPRAYPGMSLRDWFAGQALPGILTAFAHRARLPARDQSTSGKVSRGRPTSAQTT